MPVNPADPIMIAAQRTARLLATHPDGRGVRELEMATAHTPSLLNWWTVQGIHYLLQFGAEDSGPMVPAEAAADLLEASYMTSPWFGRHIRNRYFFATLEALTATGWQPASPAVEERLADEFARRKRKAFATARHTAA